MEAELDEVRREARFRADDAEIRHHRKAETAANGRSLHRRDHGRFGIEKAHGGGVERVAAGRAPDLRGRRARLAEVVASAEMLALGAEHDGATVVVVVHVLECGRHVVDEIHIEEIVWPALDFQRRDVAVLGEFDVAVVHVLPSASIAGRQAYHLVGLRRLGEVRQGDRTAWAGARSVVRRQRFLWR